MRGSLGFLFAGEGRLVGAWWGQGGGWGSLSGEERILPTLADLSATVAHSLPVNAAADCQTMVAMG